MQLLYEDQYTLLITSRSFLLRMTNVSDKICKENQNTHFVFSFFFFNGAFDEIMWKNIVERGRPQIQYGACALHAGYLRLQIHTLRLCNTHGFSTATMVARTRLDVT